MDRDTTIRPEGSMPMEVDSTAGNAMGVGESDAMDVDGPSNAFGVEHGDFKNGKETAAQRHAAQVMAQIERILLAAQQGYIAALERLGFEMLLECARKESAGLWLREQLHPFPTSTF